MGVQNSENLKNRKHVLKHLRTMLETIIGHVEVPYSLIVSLICNLNFSFFGNFQKIWEFSIFSAFPTKIHQSISEVWLTCMCVQNSENDKNRKNALKHLRTMLGTIVGHVEVL